MFEQINQNASVDLEDWVKEMKAEISQNAKSKSKKFNFDFEKNKPESEKDAKFKWALIETGDLGVGNNSIHRAQSIELNGFVALASFRGNNQSTPYKNLI
jgi:Cyclin-dependent kinase inhibitor.